MDARTIVNIYSDLTSKGFDHDAVIALLESRKPASPAATKPEVPKTKRTPGKDKPGGRRERTPGPSIISKALKALAAGPMVIEELATEIKAEAPSVRVAMKRAAAKGLVVREEDGSFHLPFRCGTTQAL